MASKNSKTHDGYVTENDMKHFRDRVNQGEFQQLVWELMAKEPDLAIAVSLRNERFSALLQTIPMSAEQREKINRHVTLSVWLPLIALSQAHRRAWDEFLPDSDDDGGDYGPVTAEEP